MTYGPGPTPPEGYDPSNQYGYPPPGGGVPPSYPPNAPVGGYPQDQYGGLPAGYPAPGMPPGDGPTGYGPYPGGPGYPPPTNNGLKIALVAVATAVVLGGAGLGTYFLLQEDTPSAAPQATAAATESSTAAPASDTQPAEQEPQDQQVPAVDNGGKNIDASHLLPTSAVFVPVPGELLPEQLEGHKLKLTDISTDYQHTDRGNWSNFSLDWARIKANKVGSVLEYLDDQKDFGDVQCARSGKSPICIVEHPRHPEIWLRVRSYESSMENTVSFAQKIIELWK